MQHEWSPRLETCNVKRVQYEKRYNMKRVQHEKKMLHEKSAKKAQHETVERKKWREMKRMHNKKFRMKTMQYEKNKT